MKWLRFYIFLILSISFLFHCAKEKGGIQSRNMDTEHTFVHPKEFEKIAEQNFVGKWQGQILDKNSQIQRIDLEIKRSEENEFLVQLSVPATRIMLYKTQYLLGRNVLEGEGFTMEPVMGGYALFWVTNHPSLSQTDRINVSLVAD